MIYQPTAFHFPEDVELNTNPLVEAWLEIRWELVSQQPASLSLHQSDPDFPFALGAFYNSIKDEYGHRESLMPASIPEELLPPYMVRYRFRSKPEVWPVLQLGPGIATVNFTKPYSWRRFKSTALYLREKLLAAYGENKPRAQQVALRYRNAIDFDYGAHDLLEWMSDYINLNVSPSQFIPGSTGRTKWPTSMNVSMSYELKKPDGVGSIRIATAIKNDDSESSKPSQTSVVLFELEVVSKTDVPQLDDIDGFEDWLSSAHGVTHEWFLALIQGPLARQYGCVPEVR